MEEVELFQVSLQEENSKKDGYEEQCKEVQGKLKKILDGLILILLEVNPKSSKELDSQQVIVTLEILLTKVLDNMFPEEDEEEAHRFANFENNEEKWLPAPYSGLVRRTPVPQQGQSPVPQTGSGKVIDLHILIS